MVNIAFTEIEFADGTKVDMKPGDIIVLTGPNNGGKSNVLRNLQLRSMSLVDAVAKETIKSTKTRRTGSFEELLKFLRDYYPVEEEAGNHYLIRGGPIGNHRITAEHWAANELSAGFARKFATLLTARDRFSVVDDRNCVNYGETEFPIQKLRYAEDVEKTIGGLTKIAFGLDVCCFLNGTTLQLKTGDRSKFPTKDDYRTKNEQLKGRALTALRDEGDGIQSFTGVLMATLVEPVSITLIDEAEAFLHPPQARRLATDLATKTPKSAQLIVATHDYDFVRGLVSAGGDRVHVVRIRRAKGATVTKHLPNTKVKDLWSDPLLFTSDVLSALFHDVAIICEGESDVRFFRAMVDALDATLPQPVPDMRFFSCGSKGKLDKMAASLVAVGVPTIVIADCDVFNSRDIMLRILTSLAATVADFNTHYVSVAKAVNDATNPKTASAVIAELKTIIELMEKTPANRKLLPFPSAQRNKVTAAIEEPSQWAMVKKFGRAAVVPLDAKVTRSFDHICAECLACGFIINTAGELESFWPDGPRDNKAEWLAQALAKDLAKDPALDAARKFVAAMVEKARVIAQSP